MLLEKWDQAIFPHLCRSDGKGRGARRWEASVQIIGVYWLAAQTDSRKWSFDAVKATSVHPPL